VDVLVGAEKEKQANPEFGELKTEQQKRWKEDERAI